MVNNPITAEKIDQEKLQIHLECIQKIKQFASNNHYRVVVSGGYGLDFLCHQVTRNHGDIDVIIYGQQSRQDAGSRIIDFLNQQFPNNTVKSKNEQFYLNIDLYQGRLTVNAYYVQTAQDPHKDLNQIIDSDGITITNTPERFPPPQKGFLNGIKVEVDDPNLHLADILCKQKTLENRQSHAQDIQNLRLFTSEEKVEAILARM